MVRKLSFLCRTMHNLNVINLPLIAAHIYKKTQQKHNSLHLYHIIQSYIKYSIDSHISGAYGQLQRNISSTKISYFPLSITVRSILVKGAYCRTYNMKVNTESVHDMVHIKLSAFHEQIRMMYILIDKTSFDAMK